MRAFMFLIGRGFGKRWLRRSMKAMMHIKVNQRQMIFIMDSKHTMLYANSAARQFIEAAEASGAMDETARFLLSLMKERTDPAAVYPMEEKVVDCSRSTCFLVTSDKLNLPGSGSVYWHLVQDMTIRDERCAALHCSAVTDPLTGTLNRRGGLMELERLIEAPFPGRHTLAFLDLDGLKGVNDSFGHGAGDRFITVIADLLRASISSTDVLCRYGGDEFFVVFRNGGRSSAEQTLARALEEARRQGLSGRMPYPVSFSYGIIEFHTPSAQTADALLRLADEQMYRMKRRSGTTF
jgi:diguanylate cyclase (GGDEF)-like protein